VSAVGRAAAGDTVFVRGRRWLVPDLALVAASVTLFYCLFLFNGYQKLFRDSDAGWHIRTGEAILSTGALPRTDPYSFTRGGRPWFAWEWGADAMMGAVHHAAGLSGVAILTAGEFVTRSSRTVGVIAVLLGVAAWAIGVCVSPRLELPRDAMGRAAIPSICGAGLLWVAAGVYMADSRGMSTSSDLPSGVANRTFASASMTTMASGCWCIVLFEPAG
jgi:hypothetical protein